MPRTRKGVLVIVGLLVMLALFLACKAPEAVRTSQEGGGAGTPIVLPTRTPLPADVKPIPGGVLRSYYPADPPYWDPNMGVSNYAYETLQRVHTTLVQFPFGPKFSKWDLDIDTANSFAQSWEVSQDGLTYTFHLRQGVKWQNIPPMNGREFVATDAKFALETQIKTGSAPRHSQLEVINSIECPDKYTLVLHLKERRADMLQILASPYCIIDLAPELVAAFGDLNSPKAVIGVGPFILEDFVPSVKTVYKKNPNYYRSNEGLPYLDGIYNVMITDASTSLAGFRAEKIDIRGVSRIDLASVKQTNPDIYCAEGELGASEFGLAFRTDKPPFSDARLRQAVSMALDRKSVIDTLYFGYALEQWGPIHAASPWYLKDQGECAKYYQYNPEAARKLLADAGYPNGLSVSMLLYSPSEMDEFWVDSLSKVGIKVTMKTVELGAYMNVLYVQKSYDDIARVQMWGGATLCPDTWLNSIYGTGYVNNYSRVSDPKLDAMLNAQMVEMDPVKRQEIINDIQRYEACEMHYVHWPMSWGVTCMHSWVRDYQTHAASYHTGRIAELIWLTEDAPSRKGPGI